jgi:hypothetical protein
MRKAALAAVVAGLMFARGRAGAPADPVGLEPVADRAESNERADPRSAGLRLSRSYVCNRNAGCGEQSVAALGRGRSRCPGATRCHGFSRRHGRRHGSSR